MDLPDLRNPGICMPESTSCFATVLGPNPPTSSHVIEKTMAKVTMMPAKAKALTGSAMTCAMVLGAVT